jgi:exodeoxyribonuclease-3
MKIVSWNVNGLRAVLAKGLDDYLVAEAADIYCLQEIKASPEQVAGWQAPAGYHVFWNPATRKGYSGTMVLSKLEPVAVRSGIGEPVGDAEGRCQLLEFAAFHVVNVYTPNAKGDLSRLAYRTGVWDPAFRTCCAQLAKDKPVIFCGDLNVAHQEIDLANPKSNRNSAGFTDAERAAFSELLAAGFCDTFRQLHPGSGGHSSWWSYRAGARARNVGWRIDYVCCSLPLLEQLSGAFIRPEVMGSDHCPVGAEFG